MSSRHTPQDPSPSPHGVRDEILLGFLTERESDYARISRFLHDEVGQVLSAVGLQLDALRHDLGAHTPEIEQRTTEIQQMLETMIARIRDLSYELNPSVVQRTGLQFALERLAGRFHQAFSGGVRLQLDPTVRVPPDRAEAMYRGAEAALELATAAPDCSHVDVHLKRSRNDFVLEIRANAGIEFEAASSFPALLMNYYASRNQIALNVYRSNERDTIVRFSCSADS